MKSISNAMVRWTFRRLMRSVVWVGQVLYGLEIRGREHLPSQGPLILIGRHNSRVDFFHIAFTLSTIKDIHYLTAALALGNSRIRTWLGRTVGARPVLKEKGLTAPHLMELYKALQQGKIIGLTDNEVSWDGRLQLPRPGAAWLGLRAHAPIIVASLEGGYDIWPRWAKRPHLTGKLVMRIGKPFYLADGPMPRVTETMLLEGRLRIKAELEAITPHRSPDRQRVA